MSTTIDQRVVEMRFENGQFEKNVATSMSTLAKLKERLNLTGASKGLENVNTAAKNVNMTGLGNAVDAVRVKFSALQVMGITTLTNLTNSAVNAGKRIATSLTIDPIKTGFSEYETKINSIQTILSNTSNKGEDIQSVTRVIDELNEYADKTIYNFSEMTRNIGTFTAAGVGLKESAAAIKGIANLAAASGSTSQQASTAMYQLSQALAAGTVKLMDWNSVVNAGMGGEKFQEALKATAREHGVAVDKIIEKQGSFRESLSEGWITADILNETLNKFTVDGATAYAKSMMEAGKWTQAQADALIEEAQSMEDAATKVKTFTQLIDTMKESIQSGWGKTWELIFGDFEEAKNMFSKLSDVFGNVIEKVSNWRNNLVEGAFGSKWSKFTEIIDKAGISTDKFTEKLKTIARGRGLDIDGLIKEYGSLKDVIDSGKISTDIIKEALSEFAKAGDGAAKSTENMNEKLEYFQKVVDQVWHGDFKNGAERVEALTKAGYNYAEVQALVNKTVDGHRLTLDDLNESQLKNLGYTDDQIDTYRRLKEEAKKTGVSVDELIESMSKPTGRQLLIESFYNIIEAIKVPLKAVKDAWDAVFDDFTSDDLYGIIEKFHEFSESLIMSEDAAERFKTVMEGLISMTKLAGGLIKLSFISSLKILTAVLEAFGTDLGEVAEIIAQYIIKFADFVKANTFYIDTIGKIADIIVVIIKGIKRCIDAFLDLKLVDNVIKKFKDTLAELLSGFGNINDWNIAGLIDGIVKMIEAGFDKVEAWIKTLDDPNSIGHDIVTGLALGIAEGAAEVIRAIVDLGKRLIESFKEVVGVHSPSIVFQGIGRWIIAGLLLGLVIASPDITNFFKTLGTACIDLFEKIPFKEAIAGMVETIKKLFKYFDLGSIIAILIGGGIIMSINKLSDVMKAFASPIKAFEGVFKSISGFFNSLSDVQKAKAQKEKAKSMVILASGVLMLAGAVIMLGKLDKGELLRGGAALTVLILCMGGLAFASKKLGDIIIGFNANKIGIMVLAISGALLIMAFALKQIASIELTNPEQTIALVVSMIGGMGLIVAAFGLFMRGPYGVAASENMGKAGSMFMKMSIAILIMSFAIKQLAKLDEGDIDKGLWTIVKMELLFAALVAIAKWSNTNVSGVGGMILKISVALLLMIGVVKLASMIPPEDVARGIIVVGSLVLLFKAIISSTMFLNQNAQYAGKVGLLLISISAALAIMVTVVKQASKLSVEEIMKGTAAVGALTLLFGAIIFVSQYAGQHAAKAGVMLLMMAGAMLILAGVIHIIKNIPLEELVPAVAAVAVLELLIAAIVKCSQGVNDIKGTMIGIAIIIGILSAALIGLSFIPYKRLIPATAALSAVMLSLAGLFASLKGIRFEEGELGKTIGAMYSLVGVVALVGVILAAMSHWGNPEGLIQSGVAVGLVLLALSGSFAIISKSNGMTPENMKNVYSIMIALGVAMVAAGTVLTIMSRYVVDPNSLIPIATGLGILLLSLSASLVIISYASPTATKAAAALAILGVVVGELAFILAMMQEYNVQPSIETAKALSILLLAMSGSLVILGVVGLMGPAAYVGIGAMATMIAGIGGLLVSIGALMDKFPALETFLNKGIPVLEKIGFAIGSFFGNIVGGFLSGATSDLPAIGATLSDFMSNASGFITGVESLSDNFEEKVKGFATAILVLCAADLLDGFSMLGSMCSTLPMLGSNLSSFMENAQGFITGLESLDETKVAAAKMLAETIMVLCAADLLTSIGNLLDFGDDDGLFEKFGANLEAFGEAIVKFSNVVSEGNINDEAVELAKDCGMMMAELQKALYGSGGFIQAFAGEKNLAEFGRNIVQYGNAIVAFSQKVSAEGAVNAQAIEAAKAAGEIMLALQGQLDATGGVIQAFTGEKNLALFGQQLWQYGNALVLFSQTVSADGAINTEAITAAKDMGLLMAELQNSMDPLNGCLDFFSSEKNLETFGKQIVKYGEAMVDFSKVVSEGNLNTNAATSAATMGEALANLQKALPEDKWFDGKMTLEDFGDQVKAFGNDMKAYGKSVGEVNSEAISSSATAAKTLANVLKGLVEIDPTGVENFKIEKIGSAMKSYSEQVSTVDPAAISASSSSARTLVSVIKNTAGLDTSGVGNFVDAINKLGQANVNKFVEAFAGATDKVRNVGGNLITALTDGIKSKYSTLTTCGNNIVTNLKNGITAKKSDVTNILTQLLTSMTNSIKNKLTSFRNAGSDIIEKFISGMTLSAGAAMQL